MFLLVAVAGPHLIPQPRVKFTGLEVQRCVAIWSGRGIDRLGARWAFRVATQRRGRQQVPIIGHASQGCISFPFWSANRRCSGLVVKPPDSRGQTNPSMATAVRVDQETTVAPVRRGRRRRSQIAGARPMASMPRREGGRRRS